MKTLLSFFFILPLALSAQTYYVDVNSGNDSDSGFLSSPWQRLDTAINRLDAGDTLNIRGGDYTYLNQIVFQNNGTSAQPIIIQGYQNESVLVEGFTIGFSSWLEIKNIHFVGPQTIPTTWVDMPATVIDNLNINSNDTLEWEAPDFRIDSVLNKYATYAKFTNYGYTSDSTWENYSSIGLNIINCENLVLSNNEIENHTYGIRLKNDSRYLEIHNNYVHHCLDGISGFCDTTNYTFSFGYSNINNNNIEQSFRNGIILVYGAHHNTVDQNIVMFSGQNHISTYNLVIQSDSSGYNIFSKNIVAYGGYYGDFMQFPGPSGISIHSPGPGVEVISNYIAYQTTSAAYGNNYSDGNCMISDNNPHGSNFYNNVCYRPKGNGISIVKAQNNKLVHNTIMETGFDDAISVVNGAGIKFAESDDTSNIVSNNLFYETSRGGIFARWGNLSGQDYIDHNLYYLTNGSPLAADGTSNLYYSLPYLTFESNGDTLDPILLDTLGHIEISSATIDAGGILHSYPTDFNGTSRSITSPTIGAFETGSGLDLPSNYMANEPILVYPNPASSFIIVNGNNEYKKTADSLIIRDLSGKQIFSKVLPCHEQSKLDISKLKPGIYLIQFMERSIRFVKI